MTNEHTAVTACHHWSRPDLALKSGLSAAIPAQCPWCEIERLNRYVQIVESYLDRETLKEVLKKYRASPDGKALEPGVVHRKWPGEPPHCASCDCGINDGATHVRASTSEVVLPKTAETTASPVHPEPASREVRMECLYCPARFMTAWELEVHEKEHALKSAAAPTRVTVGCSQCTATVSLPQYDGQVDIESLGLWYFSTATGWRCPAHAPAQQSTAWQDFDGGLPENKL